MLTVHNTIFLVTSFEEPVATLPTLIYAYGKSAQEKEIAHAWGAALVLMVFVLSINIVVRLLASRRQRAD
jgi:ABC-type phosphate transport system permease subunit